MNKFKILFLIAMSLKPLSILHALDSITVLIGKLFTSSALYIIIVEVLAICEVSLDDHCRFFSKPYKRAAPLQSCFTGIAGIAGLIYGTRVISALP